MTYGLNWQFSIMTPIYMKELSTLFMSCFFCKLSWIRSSEALQIEDKLPKYENYCIKLMSQLY